MVETLEVLLVMGYWLIACHGLFDGALQTNFMAKNKHRWRKVYDDWGSEKVENEYWLGALASHTIVCGIGVALPVCVIGSIYSVPGSILLGVLLGVGETIWHTATDYASTNYWFSKNKGRNFFFDQCSHFLAKFVWLGVFMYFYSLR